MEAYGVSRTLAIHPVSLTHVLPAAKHGPAGDRDSQERLTKGSFQQGVTIRKGLVRKECQVHVLPSAPVSNAWHLAVANNPPTYSVQPTLSQIFTTHHLLTS
jgi:hypothetical protein